MSKTFKINLITTCALALFTGAAWGVNAADKSGGYSQHSYHQQKPAKLEIQVILPEIIHTPPLQISSTEDFFIAAQITNLETTGGIPIIYYRFDGDKDYFKRALRKSNSGQFQFKILSAALTGNKIEYYIEVSTGSKVLASLGDKNTPIQVAIVGPAHNTVVLWLAIIAAAVGLLAKLVISANARSRKAKAREKTRVVVAAEPVERPKRHPQLSVRSH